MKIHCFQHVLFENPGSMLEWAEINYHTLTYTCFFKENYSIPALSEIDALIVLGGYMNVNDEEIFQWLVEEKQFIKQVIEKGKKVIGICLGSQLVAAALGNNVYPNTVKEIGFFPITFSDYALRQSLFSHFANPYTVFHWHGDTFDLPANAKLIASTSGCKNQAYYISNNVLGLQFHLEMTEVLIEDMLANDANELKENGNYVQSVEEIKTNYHYLLQNKKDMFLLLNKFLK
jgi:GMP synthase-like glutamine amidotransferase